MPAKKKKSTPVTSERKRTLRLHGRIARDIGVRIVSGKLDPGSILEGEIEASARLRVSRTAYREAMRILTAKGLVESRPKLGTRVSQPGRWHLLDPDVLGWMFANDPDEQVLSSLFELRTIVEPAACALAATRCSKAQLQTLRDALNRMARHTLEHELGQQADREFHAVLLEASGNRFLASLSSGIAAALLWVPTFQHAKGPLLRDPIPDHERVYQAIATKDPAAAAQAMSQLIELALLDTRRRHAPPTRRKRNDR